MDKEDLLICLSILALILMAVIIGCLISITVTLSKIHTEEQAGSCVHYCDDPQKSCVKVVENIPDDSCITDRIIPIYNIDHTPPKPPFLILSNDTIPENAIWNKTMIIDGVLNITWYELRNATE